MGQLIQDIDYRIQGYQKKRTFDAKGDLVNVKYYRNFNTQTQEYEDLMVDETRTYERDSVSTLLVKRTMNIKWYIAGKLVAEKTEIPKHYDSKQGYQGNKRARQNLIDNASMYLLSAVGLSNATSYLVTLGNNIGFYIDGNIDPLVNQIASSTEPYMTAQVKGTLDTILNVRYGQ